MNARDIMTENPITVVATDSIADAVEILQDSEIRHLPVVEEGSLVGMLSDRDFRDLMLPMVADESEQEEIHARYQQAVSAIMSSNVVKVDPDADVTEVIEQMLEQRVGAVPVVDPTDGSLVGIISYIDVLRVAHGALKQR